MNAQLSKAIRTAKRLILSQPHGLLLAEYYAWWLTQAPKNARHAVDYGFESTDGFRTSEFKTSDTVFILGSGWSINEISEAGWESIRQHDSIGFNFWAVHPHRPNLYFFEAANPIIASSHTAEVVSQFISMAQSRPDYRDIPKIMTDFEPSRWTSVSGLPEAWRENLFSANTVPLFARNEFEAATAMRFLDAIGVFDVTDDVRLLLKYRATVVMLVGLAVRMGYRRIVLCGIDMSDPRYFYQSGDYKTMSQFQSSPAGVTHATLWDEPMQANVPDCIYAMNDVILKPRGIQIFVENRTSALYPRIPECRACDV